MQLYYLVSSEVLLYCIKCNCTILYPVKFYCIVSNAIVLSCIHVMCCYIVSNAVVLNYIKRSCIALYGGFEGYRVARCMALLKIPATLSANDGGTQYRAINICIVRY